jgi:UDP-N-acetylglucosamine 2-epimerase (non-hydrolysing)
MNLTYSSIARDYLLNEGLPADQIIKTGSPMKEVLDFYSDNIIASDILKKLKLKPSKYFLVSSHREENVDNPKNLKKIINILNTLIEKYDYPIIFSTHPRTQKKLNSLSLKLNEKINFLKPFGFFDYVKLQIDAKCVLSDSGTITEESSILNFPALNIREVHERPEGFEEASVIMTGLNPDLVLQSLELINDQPRGKDRLLNIVDDYRPSNVSEKVVRIILSYTDFIKRKVWHK